jgi:hypothetical protein
VQWLAWLGLLGLIVLLAAWTRYLGVGLSSTDIMMGLFLWMLGAFPLARLIFVLGRLIGGNLVGFHFVELTVGPLKLQREARRLRLKRNRTQTRYGSVTLCAPDDTSNLHRRLIWPFAAGSIANLVAAAFALLLTPFLDPLLFGVGPLFAVMNLWVVVEAMAPYPWGSAANDGTFLRMLVQTEPAKVRDWMAVIAMRLAYAWRPREVKPELLDAALGVPDGTQGDVLAHLVASMATLDRGDLRRAAEHLRYALSKGTDDPELRRWLLLESAYLAARQEAPIAARYYLKQAQSELGGRARSRWRATPTTARGAHARPPARAG